MDNLNGKISARNPLYTISPSGAAIACGCEFDEQAPCVYIIFTSTLTGIGRLIRFVTRHKYNHTSISFDPTLAKMYSFARYYSNAPLVSGFIEESPLRYYFHKGKKSVFIRMFKIPLTEEVCAELQKHLTKMLGDKERYLYNSVSFVGAAFHKKITVRDSYTCAEFATALLKKFGIIDFDDKKYYSIEELEEIMRPYIYYDGEMRGILKNEAWGNDEFYRRVSFTYALSHSVKNTKSLIGRLLFERRG